MSVTEDHPTRWGGTAAREAARFWSTPRAMSLASWSDAWPPVDIYQDGNGIVLEAEVPGVHPHHLEITVEKSRVILQGKRFHHIEHIEHVEGAGEGARAEERFYRAVALPYIVEPEGTQATLRHGLLQVRMPRGGQAPRRRIPVTVHTTAER